MRTIRKTLLTFWLIMCLLPPRAMAMDPANMIDMMRIMAGMMSMWNMFSSVTGNNGFGNGFDMPFNSFSPGIFSSPMNNYYNSPNRYNYQNNPPPPNQQRRVSPLDGVWLSQDGIMLTVRGQQFEMKKKGTRSLHGTLMLTNNRLITYILEEDVTLPFRFEFKNNMFILQATNGQMMLFKRIR